MRSLARGFAALILLLPVNSHALGLGDIEVHSALNQPLDAEISLLSAESVSLQEINVELASIDAFAQAQVERPVFLTKIKFRPDRKKDGTLYVRVTSEESIKEPFLDFLIEVNWPNGRLLREYTLLLDPPVLLDESPGSIRVPATTATTQAIQEAPGDVKPTQASVKTQVKDSSASATSLNGGVQYGPVTTTDTLWSIASQMIPGKSVTVHQVMMALLKNNPNAFYNNNVNELKAGYVLRLNDPALITAMSKEAALQEFQIQYQQWQDVKQNKALAPGQRPLGLDADSAAAASATADGGTVSGAQLKLAVPSEGDATSASRSATARVELDALRQELTIALETSDVTRQENQELRARITAMEEQIASMQRLVTLKDDTLSSVQGAAVQPEPAAQATDKVGEAPVEMAVPENTAPQEEATPAQETAPPSPAPVTPASESAIDMLLKDPLTLGLAGLVILCIIALVYMTIRRRRMAVAAFDEGILAAAEQVSDETDAAIESAMAGYASETAMDAIAADSDEMDVLAEADVYLAYRRFDKAIELLNQALQQEPGRTDYTMKLLEVYAESENVDDFVAKAEQLYASIGPQGGPLWDKVVKLGKKLIPEHPLFGGIAAGASAQSQAGGAADPVPRMADISGTTQTAAGDPDLIRDIPASGENESGESLLESSLEFTDETTKGMETSDSSVDEGLISSFAMDNTAGLPDRADNVGNMLDFESGLLPETPAKESGESTDGTQKPEATVDTANMIEFEAGLAPAKPAVKKSEQVVDTKQAEGGNDDLDWLANIDDDLTEEGDISLAGSADDAGHDLFAGDGDEVDTKLDLARAYIDMDDKDSARGILDEVIKEGNETQKREAQELLQQIS